MKVRFFLTFPSPLLKEATLSFYFTYVDFLPTFVYAALACQKENQIPGTEVTESREPPCESWILKLSPLKVHQCF